MRTVLKLEQFSNAHSSMEITEGGIVIDVRLLHTANARLPMKATESGIVIDGS